MQSLTRSGVEFDMCPSCRGVWLDRGELEKLIAAEPAVAAAAPPPQDTYARPGYVRDDRRYDDDRRRHDEGYRPKKRSSIFDIFD